MRKQSAKGTNARAFFYGRSFHSSANAFEAERETQFHGHSKDRIYVCKCGHDETHHVQKSGPCRHGICICQNFRTEAFR